MGYTWVGITWFSIIFYIWFLYMYEVSNHSCLVIVFEYLTATPSNTYNTCLFISFELPTVDWKRRPTGRNILPLRSCH